MYSCYGMCPSLGKQLFITKDFKLLYSKVTNVHYGKHVSGHPKIISVL